MADEQQNQATVFSENPRIHRLIEGIVEDLRAFTEEQATNLNELANIGSALSAQRDPDVILEMIVQQARRFTNADGGTVYLVTDDEKELAFHVVQTESLNIAMGGMSGNPVTIPNVKLYDENGNYNHTNVSAYVATTGEVVNIPDVYEAEGFNFEGTKKFDQSLKYRSMSMLVSPLRDHEDEIIGVLQLINARDRNKKTIAFSAEMVEMTLALASQAAVAITQRRLISDLKNLFESFIKAIAAAIEEKSKYTGGHIERVAELTMQIAERINAQTEGPFADVCFSHDELDELRIAAWMHDTGKITTPEYVVDKCNKLETIFDRVNLVSTRWHAIKLERQLKAEREKVKLLMQDKDDTRIEKIEEECQADLKQLDDDIQFIRDSNTGGEFMADDKIERLENLATQKYRENGGEYPYLTGEELYNLSIRKGTLNAEERQKMNDHATMTIRILEELPWPKKLRNVPHIAGAHHEKLDGTGYPSGLKGEDIGLGARIMAVADIFEALSASDRPYKKPMPLTQAIKILGFMVKDNHIDGRIVDLFKDEGLHLEYAKQHLKPEQIDVDIEQEQEKLEE